MLQFERCSTLISLSKCAYSSVTFLTHKINFILCETNYHYQRQNFKGKVVQIMLGIVFSFVTFYFDRISNFKVARLMQAAFPECLLPKRVALFCGSWLMPGPALNIVGI